MKPTRAIYAGLLALSALISTSAKAEWVEERSGHPVSRCEALRRLSGSGMVPVYIGSGQKSIYRICRQAGSGYYDPNARRGSPLDIYVDKRLVESLEFIKDSRLTTCVDVEGERIEVQEGDLKRDVKALWAQSARCYP